MRVPAVLQILLLFVIALSAAGAQSNETLDTILRREVARTGETLYMVFLASGRATDAESEQDVYQRIGRDWSRWGLTPRAAVAPITFGEYAHVLMQAFDIPGGVMYRVAPGPRYAAREIVYRGFARGPRTAERTISGEEMLRILGNVRAWQLEQQS